MTDKGFALETLGGLRLTGGVPDDQSAAPHRQKLAVLAVLALAERPLTRDTLAALFWGDLPEKRARHSLSNALSYLRGVLGPSAIRRHRETVSLEASVGMSVDCRDFERDVAARAWADALARYRGGFLEGIHLDGSPELEQWVSRHRSRYEALFVTACAGRVEELRSGGSPAEIETVARRWLDAAPLSAPGAIALLDAIAAPGTRDADHRALAAFDELVTRLAEEFDRRPERVVIERAQAIVERLRQADATGEFRVPARVRDTMAAPPQAPPVPQPVLEPAPVPSEPVPAASAASEVPRAFRRVWPALAAVAGAAALVLVLVVKFGGGGGGSRPVTVETRPLVAVGVFRAPSDSATAWVGDGLAQMVVDRLARNARVDVVAPTQLREMVPGAAPLSVLLDAARRIGATLAVSGSVTRAEQGLLVDVSIHHTADGRLAGIATLSAADPIALANEIAVRVLATAGTAADGPSLAEVETANPEAYEQFIRYTRLADEGRIDQAITALDAAIAADSGFVSALRERASYAFTQNQHHLLPGLLAAFQRNAGRATNFDRLLIASQEAFYTADHARAETVARELVDRYPKDPRSHGWLSEVYEMHGRWAESEAVLLDLLALDSLATRSGAGVCVPCRVHASLVLVRLAQNNPAGAIESARVLTRLTPGLVRSWGALAVSLAGAGRLDDAIFAIDSAIPLDPLDLAVPSLRGRLLMRARRFDEADSLVRGLRLTGSPQALNLALDLGATLARERGRHRAAIAILDTLFQGGDPGLTPVAASSLGILGRYREAVPLVAAPPPSMAPGAGGLRVGSRIGDLTRAFVWQRTLESDAAAAVGDTVRLRILADSLERLGTRSYYARDWRLHHHVRGLLQLARKDYAGAATSFQAGRYGAMGLGTTIAGEAQALAAMNRLDEALAVLRVAYLAPLDAMGRYLPKSEIDYRMADLFRRAGREDSFTVYRDRAAAAWVQADPEIRRRLAALDQLP